MIRGVQPCAGCPSMISPHTSSLSPKVKISGVQPVLSRAGSSFPTAVAVFWKPAVAREESLSSRWAQKVCIFRQ